MTHIAKKWIAGLFALLALAGNADAATQIVYYHNDLTGSPLAATDAGGNVVWRESYRPYGERQKNEPAAQSDEMWFTSRHQDADTGLVYMGARYYDPTLGRFLAPDPMRFGTANIHSFNRYAYANNNPLKFNDPDGLAGQLTIHSSGNGGTSMTDGHSWVVYKPDGKGEVTLGTWGNNPTGQGNGLFEDLEKGRTGDASRSVHMDDASEKSFLDKVDQYRKLGDDGWQLGGPCSTFARDAWEAGTGEKLKSNWGPISNPTTLKESIIDKNGGNKHTTIQKPNKDSSPPSGPSSSSASSGSSVNPMKSSL